MFIAGDSAGGNLATTIDAELATQNERLSGAIMIYPAVQLASMDMPSMRKMVHLLYSASDFRHFLITHS